MRILVFLENKLKILADKNIPHINELFNLYNRIDICDGRTLTRKFVKNVDILLIRSVTKVNQKLLNDSCLKFVGTVTSGVDHVDQNYLRRCGIKFAYAPGSNSVSVVEYVITALFWLAQRDNFFLKDKIIGIIGVGNIGSLLYKRLCSLGIHTLLCDPPLSKKDKSKEWKTLEKIVSESHILTIHTPLTYLGEYSTWHMINHDVLEALPSNGILINTCRGAVIDNYALLNILRSGKKLRIVLDVWEFEPKLLLPLLSYVDIGTPHIAGYTSDSKIRGILQVYNVYCDIFNIFNKKYVSNLLPTSMQYVIIRKKIDEVILNKLIKRIYNIHYDNRLRNCLFVPNGFDKLREYYWSRREWSSVCIQTHVDSDIEVFHNLGFTV